MSPGGEGPGEQRAVMAERWVCRRRRDRTAARGRKQDPGRSLLQERAVVTWVCKPASARRGQG